MKKIGQLCLAIFLCLSLMGCTAQQSVQTQVEVPGPETEKKDETSASYATKADSLDRAVIERVDLENNQMTFWNLTLGKSYTLSFDSATGIEDRFGAQLVAAQLQEGDIVNVTFQKEERLVKNIWLDPTVSTLENVSEFELHITASSMVIKDEQYALDKNVSVLSQGEEIALMDITDADNLRIFSQDHNIMSIVIAKGHGYVRLLSADNFAGGWVEFGQSIIRPVNDDNLYVVPEGSYDLLLSKGKLSGSYHVDVRAGEETSVDVSEANAQGEVKKGGIVFTINPLEAKLTIDDTERDFSDVVELDYGIHKLTLKADGYKTISQYIKVGAKMANISITMQAGDDEEKDEKESVSANSPSKVTTASDGYQVYIDAPEDAELYVDGKYIGLIPTSFDKKQGSYTISLRKNGYMTRSYSLEVDGAEKDVHYSFSALEEN